MTGWSGFLPVLGRVLAPAAIAAAAIALAVRACLPGGAARREEKARPARRGRAELARILEKAGERPYYRDAAAERLRRLGRGALALREGLDEAGARARLEKGAAEIDPGLAELISEDFMTTGKAAQRGIGQRGIAQRDFLDRLDGCVGALERYVNGGGHE